MLIGSKMHAGLFSLQAGAKDEILPGFKNFPAIKKPAAKYEPSRAARQVHMMLDAEILFETNSFRGTCYLVVEAANETSSFTFDAKELVLDSVSGARTVKTQEWDNVESLGYAAAKFEYSDDVVTIHLDSPLKSSEFYVVKCVYNMTQPKAGIYFVHKNKESDSEYDCVWTQGQDVDSPFWFPCQDDPKLKMTTTCRFHFPAAWHAISNGLMTSEKINGKTKTQTWKLSRPHSPYLVAFAAGEMEYAEDKWRGKPVTLLLPKKYAAHKTALLKDTTAMLEFYSNYWGYEYAWEKYGQAFVADFLYGGMENTSITINTDLVLGPKEFSAASDGYTYLVMHEMAHQWFGDNLTCETWSEGWLNEGFATHSELLWDEHVNGKVSGIFYSMINEKGWYLDEARTYWRPVVTNQYEFVSEIFDGHLYSKGALVLNHLRDLIGEDSFRKTVGHYLRKNEFSPVRTPDLIRAIEETTGWNPRKFFDTYIYRGGHVELDVNVKETTLGKACVEIDFEQKQRISNDFPAFEFETFVHLEYEDGTHEEVRVSCTDAKQTLLLPAQRKLSFAIVDPRGTLIGESKQKFPEKMAQAILKSNANAYFKYLAAASVLANNVTAENVTLVTGWLKEEKCVRARMASYEMIAGSKAFGADELLLSLDEKEGRAHLSWVGALGRIATFENATKVATVFEKIANDKAAPTLVRAQAITSLKDMAQRTSSMRADGERARYVKFAHSLLKDGSFAGHVEAASISLLAELGDEKEFGTFTSHLEMNKAPWRIRVGGLNALARYSVRFPLMRSDIRPHLLRYAAKFFPVRLAAQLPSAWAESKDPIYGEAFETFINRKNYGLLSMLIPKARRSQERYNRNLDPNTASEKFAELSELKQKLAKLEFDFASMKEMLAKSNPVNKV